MMKSQKKSGALKAPADNDRLADLLRCVPTEAFVSMVSRSGIPSGEARELCDQFKRLKG
jgi:hypothetical protein